MEAAGAASFKILLVNYSMPVAFAALDRPPRRLYMSVLRSHIKLRNTVRIRRVRLGIRVRITARLTVRLTYITGFPVVLIMGLLSTMYKCKLNHINTKILICYIPNQNVLV